MIQPGWRCCHRWSGSGQDKADYAAPKDWVTYPNASALQQILPRKVATP
ncbi:hypothetical protein J4732_09745 [Serratia marcescens]|uniref:Uncharacterized protein n=1 Tax=Serratia marcescens TaxID=615 RepID=A0A939NPU6_SERMA|nr:hypothetical protein [Serratia marcescens]